MTRERDLLICAVQFMTRLPTPALPAFVPEWISRAAKYFPLVGQLVGALSAAVFVVGTRLWGQPVAAVLAIVGAVLITGAFHEDGLADTADGLGGGIDRDRRLIIMKDSRIGTYGALALIASFSLKAAALAQIPIGAAVGLMIFGHGAARCAAVVVMHLLPYAGDPTAAKVKPTPEGITAREVAVAGVLTVWPLLIAPKEAALWGVAAGTVLAVLIARLARRLIGGQTGDVLGAVEQVFEIGFFLGAVALLRSQL